MQSGKTTGCEGADVTDNAVYRCDDVRDINITLDLSMNNTV